MITEKESMHIDEILTDAAAHPGRLTAWENSFLANLRDGHNILGTRMVISEKQWDVIAKIERKLYST